MIQSRALGMTLMFEDPIRTVLTVWPSEHAEGSLCGLVPLEMEEVIIALSYDIMIKIEIYKYMESP